ncbi:hypothetical protein NDU88_002670 [Pleurodeles waltl]|uniref:Uncharacterized protein n=1 Tax=Pleurodeles waltl TaxID=8319 RepID=A0AAV7RAN4_PLEWA|nr:hypothetical protein NDU88_002670 [Pleurodeles waltl]
MQQNLLMVVGGASLDWRWIPVSEMELRRLDGIRPHTAATCADAATTAPEHRRSSSNGGAAGRTTREGGALKEAASGSEKEKEAREETTPTEEEQDREPPGQEDTGERKPVWKILKVGEPFCRDRGVKSNGAAEGDGGNAATREAECYNPPRFWRSLANSGI